MKTKPKYLQIKDELSDLHKREHELVVQMRKLCPHGSIEKDGYCNDDWASHKYYTVYYTCMVCGQSESWDDEKDPLPSQSWDKFRKLYERQQQHKRSISS